MLVKSQVKYIQSLSQKKLRDEEGVFVAEGPKIINELLQLASVRIKKLFALPEWISHHAGVDAQLVTEISASELERISSLQTPNQVIGIFTKPVFDQPADRKHSITLLLDTIQDPGNMGTIIRCADWFGVKQIVCSRDSADVFNQKVVQSSMGSIGRVQVLYEDLATFIGQHKDVPVYAATLDGTNLYTLPPAERAGFILIGNESKGLHDDLVAMASQRITIPRKGQAESLNAAIATGIILGHFANR